MRFYALNLRNDANAYYNKTVWYGSELKDALLLTDKEALMKIARKHSKYTPHPEKFLKEEVRVLEFELTYKGQENFSDAK